VDRSHRYLLNYAAAIHYASTGRAEGPMLMAEAKHTSRPSPSDAVTAIAA
jgi:hypothetical protein